MLDIFVKAGTTTNTNQPNVASRREFIQFEELNNWRSLSAFKKTAHSYRSPKEDATSKILNGAANDGAHFFC